MKALVASLAIAVLLCIVALIRRAFAQATSQCGGPYDGFSFEICINAPGICPPQIGGGTPAYWYIDNSPVMIFSCVPMGNGCGDTQNTTYCSVICWAEKNMYNDCVNNVCGFSQTTNTCPH
jgi:hypothetical protein